MHRLLLTVLPTLLCAGVLVGCSGDGDDPGADASGSPSPASSSPADPPATSPATSPSATPAGADTFEPVPGLRTTSIDAELVRGFEAAEMWAGADVTQSEGAISAAIANEEGLVSTVTFGSSTELLAFRNPRQAATYWTRRSPYSQGTGELQEPVVVDGTEMQHVRVEGGVLEYDAFFHADGEFSVDVVFAIPRIVPDARQADLIAGVMSTIELQ